MFDKFFQRPDVPETIRAIRDQIYANGHISAAAFEFFSGHYDLGQKDLADALRLDPALAQRGYRALVNQLLSWSSDPRAGTQGKFIESLITHPPAGHPKLVKELKRARADLLLAPLFGSPPSEWVTHRKDLLLVVWNKPAWLLNPGVLRMLAHAWLRI